MMAVDLDALGADLAAEHAELDALVAPLDAASWDRPTPAEGWAVRDQIGHLAFFDERGAVAATQPQNFLDDLAAIATDPGAYMNLAVERGRALDAAAALGWWRTARAALLAALAAVDPALRLPWYGPPMSLASFISARLMETWAHGQDVVDGLGLRRTPTLRLRHVARLAVAARPFNYTQHGRALPERGVGVDLLAPDGATWRFGDDAAADRISGSALDFCLVAVRRRHPADTDLRIDGALATDWMAIIQAFAGPPGSGRRPGQFPRASIG